jgi:hypothetical protein
VEEAYDPRFLDRLEAPAGDGAARVIVVIQCAARKSQMPDASRRVIAGV